MKFMLSGFGIILACAVLFSAAGCGENNETTANITSGPAKPGEAPPPKDQEEYGKRLQQQQGNLKSQGYPGATGRR
jgi:hypothetical protein